MSNIVPKTVEGYWDSMETKDFAIPHGKLGQPMSRKGEPGKYNLSSGVSFTNMRVKLLAPLKTRVLYGKGMSVRSLCGSDNFYNPAPRFQPPISASCLTCYAAEWGDDDQKVALAATLERKGNIKPPLCKETYNLLMVDDKNQPFFMAFQGTALKAVSEKLLTVLKYKFHAPYLVEFNMGVIETVGEYKVFLPTFDSFAVLEGEAAQAMADVYSSFSGKAREQLADLHEQMDAEKGDSDESPF